MEGEILFRLPTIYPILISHPERFSCLREWLFLKFLGFLHGMMYPGILVLFPSHGAETGGEGVRRRGRKVFRGRWQLPGHSRSPAQSSNIRQNDGKTVENVRQRAAISPKILVFPGWVSNATELSLKLITENVRKNGGRSTAKRWQKYGMSMAKSII